MILSDVAGCHSNQPPHTVEWKGGPKQPNGDRQWVHLRQSAKPTNSETTQSIATTYKKFINGANGRHGRDSDQTNRSTNHYQANAYTSVHKAMHQHLHRWLCGHEPGHGHGHGPTSTQTSNIVKETLQFAAWSVYRGDQSIIEWLGGGEMSSYWSLPGHLWPQELHSRRSPD